MKARKIFFPLLTFIRSYSNGKQLKVYATTVIRMNLSTMDQIFNIHSWDHGDILGLYRSRSLEMVTSVFMIVKNAPYWKQKDTSQTITMLQVVLVWAPIKLPTCVNSVQLWARQQKDPSFLVYAYSKANIDVANTKTSAEALRWKIIFWLCLFAIVIAFDDESTHPSKEDYSSLYVAFWRQESTSMRVLCISIIESGAQAANPWIWT